MRHTAAGPDELYTVLHSINSLPNVSDKAKVNPLVSSASLHLAAANWHWSLLVEPRGGAGIRSIPLLQVFLGCDFSLLLVCIRAVEASPGTSGLRADIPVMRSALCRITGQARDLCRIPSAHRGTHVSCSQGNAEKMSAAAPPSPGWLRPTFLLQFEAGVRFWWSHPSDAEAPNGGTPPPPLRSGDLLLEAHELPTLFQRSGAPPPPADEVIMYPQPASGPYQPVIPNVGEPLVVSREQFERSWRVFTMDQLDGLDWTGVIAAGGSVLACATTPQPPAPAAGSEDAERIAARTFALLQRTGRVDLALSADPMFLAFHDPLSPFAKSDIDLYLHGFSAEAARQKIFHIYETLRRNAAARGSHVFFVRTQKALTFFSAYPFRMVQVVLLSYRAAEQVRGERASIPSASEPPADSNHVFNLLLCSATKLADIKSSVPPSTGSP